ncbi:ATP--guanido phosphotransferase [bacterium]|nr:ATP--guanido phosphotransferase [bacterium]
MSLPSTLVQNSVQWLSEAAPCDAVVVSTRVRFARNVAGHPFAPHATSLILQRVRRDIGEAFAQAPHFNEYYSLEMTDVSGTERGFMKEARLVSKEMERGGASRAVYVAHDLRSSVMVNEEDHLRLQALEPGFQLARAQEALTQLEAEIGRALPYAFHPRLGYLTACPTNLGTGLRASVMMHLPALALKREVESLAAPLQRQGLTVRGFHGENSDHTGDHFQVSNEVTLGRSVEEIEELLAATVNAIMEREMEARSLLLTKGGVAALDTIWRSYGVLTNARKIDSNEAMKLLSRVRLGIDHGCFPHLTHAGLNALVAEVQPGHLVLRHGAGEETEERDIVRASLIRQILTAQAQQ